MNLNKYSRQIALPFIGIEGQVSLFQTKILIIGAGALSHSSSIYLATSGIGHISIIDFDIIEESNLSRQIFFRQEDIGKYKAEILSKNLSLSELISSMVIVAITKRNCPNKISFANS